MEWIEPKYSKEKVRKAGKHILSPALESQEFKKAIEIFHNWRSAHAFPMQIMLDLLRKKALRIDKRAVVVQRLKRVRSIFGKLERENNMSLSRMEDIAGCRAVVDSIGKVRYLHEAFKKSRTKNILFRERDYITNPKESGYRGIHLVYKYNCGKKQYHGMAVELQIRSKIQHSWATAVEVVGTFTQQALKASAGDTIWLEFFKYASVEFAKLEGCPIDSRYKGVNTFLEMHRRISRLGLIDRLQAFKVAIRALAQYKEKGAGYFIMLLDIEEGSVRSIRFGKSQLAEATKFYNEREEEHKNDTNKDLVLVSAESVKELKKAYPNYFSDTDDFQRNLSNVYDAN